nr:hypothetical protein [Euryarchaeota archaeon]
MNSNPVEDEHDIARNIEFEKQRLKSVIKSFKFGSNVLTGLLVVMSLILYYIVEGNVATKELVTICIVMNIFCLLGLSSSILMQNRFIQRLDDLDGQ